ncbi:MBL fold metallo-hydrolase [Candidatus Peregrinibacteria bacterium]|nr:MBL fold metallo-hydrolase [Candidatus Peregrinibacteria bacterium]
MRNHKFAFASVITVFIAAFFFFNSMPDGLLHVYFLDVGQGDAIFMRTPTGINILVDGGPDKKILSQLKDVLPFFDSAIDYMILTHPDKDHMEGLIYVLKKYHVKRILFAGVYKNNYLSNNFFKTAFAENIPTEALAANSDIVFQDGVLIDIIFPFKQNLSAQNETNDDSLVANVIFGENEILLTGDADEVLEKKLLETNAGIDADILKVSHHGSKTASGENFLKTVSPIYSVIQVGKNNKYGHPHSAVLKRLEAAGSKIFRTDLNGRIEFIFSEKELIKINTNQ